MQRELLEAKPIYEVRAIAAQKGLPWAKTDKKAELIDRIILIDSTVQPGEKKEDGKKVERKEKPVLPILTEKQIREAIEKYEHRGLIVVCDEQNWHMSYGRLKDCGNLNMPIQQVVRCAETLLKGA